MGYFTIKLPAFAPPQGELPPKSALLRETLSTAWPSVLESFMQALVTMLDTMMVGSLGSSAIAAVGLTSQPKFLGLAVFLSMNVAVSAVVARRRGEKNQEGAVRVLRQAVLLTLCLTAAVSLVCFFLAHPIMRAVGSNADTHGDAAIYFRWIMGAMVFNTVSLVINAAQRGAGNTRVAMKSNLLSNIVNVTFNYLLIGGNFGFPALGVQGAAIATVLGTMVACGVSIVSLFRKDSYLRPWDKSLPTPALLVWDTKVLRSLSSIWSSALTEQVFARLGFLFFAILAAKLGNEAFAANQIGMNWLALSFSFADGLSVASVALSGRSLGQGRRDLAVMYSSLCQRLGVLFSCGLSVFFLAMNRWLFVPFTDEPAVLAYAGVIAMLLSVITYLQITATIYLGTLRGAGDARYVAVCLMITIGVIRPGFSWLLAYVFSFGLYGAWAGIVIDQLLRLLLSFLRFRRGKWLVYQF